MLEWCRTRSQDGRGAMSWPAGRKPPPRSDPAEGTAAELAAELLEESPLAVLSALCLPGRADAAEPAAEHGRVQRGALTQDVVEPDISSPTGPAPAAIGVFRDTGLKKGGDYGPPRGKEGGMHGFRGASGDVRAQEPGFPQISPRAPLAPCFHPPDTSQSPVVFRVQFAAFLPAGNEMNQAGWVPPCAADAMQCRPCRHGAAPRAPRPLFSPSPNHSTEGVARGLRRLRACDVGDEGV